MHHPNAIISVGCDPRDLSKDPVVRQRLGPEWVDLELRHGAHILGRGLGAAHRERDDKRCDLDPHIFLPSGLALASVGAFMLPVTPPDHIRATERPMLTD